MCAQQLSQFANAGFSVFTDNYIIYQRSVWQLLVGMYLILAGNTAYPVIFRGCLVRALVISNVKNHLCSLTCNLQSTCAPA